MLHTPKASTGISPAHREDRDLPLAPRAAFFGLGGRFDEVPPLVSAPLTHISLDRTAHCVQMVTADVLPGRATW